MIWITIITILTFLTVLVGSTIIYYAILTIVFPPMKRKFEAKTGLAVLLGLASAIAFIFTGRLFQNGFHLVLFGGLTGFAYATIKSRSTKISENRSMYIYGVFAVVGMVIGYLMNSIITWLALKSIQDLF